MPAHGERDDVVGEALAAEGGEGAVRLTPFLYSARVDLSARSVAPRFDELLPRAPLICMLLSLYLLVRPQHILSQRTPTIPARNLSSSEACVLRTLGEEIVNRIGKARRHVLTV